MYARTATGVACVAVLLAAGAAGSAPSQEIDIDAKAVITQDERVATSGTYRCVGGSTLEPIMVTSTVRQGNTSVSGGTQRAVCDGAVHTWSVSSDQFSYARLTPGDAVRLTPGAATVEATLMQLTRGEGLIPVWPKFHAANERQVVLTAQ